MAFETTNTPPSTTTRVSLTFSGLMVLKPGAAARTCEIGVHHEEPDHLFQVMLIVNRPNRPPVVGPVFTGRLETPFQIRRARNPEPAPDFIVFEDGKFDRSVVVPPDTPPPFDHRWAINLALKHPGVDINNGAQPVVTLKTGVLYTPDLTDPTFDPRFKKLNHDDERLNQFAPSLAVSIEGSIVFEGVDHGVPLEVVLPREGDPPDTTYTLALVNEPPSFAVPAHDEFKAYYKILQLRNAEIPENERFALEFADNGRLDEIPCMPTTKIP